MQVMSSVRTMFVHVYILSLQDVIHTYTQHTSQEISPVTQGKMNPPPIHAQRIRVACGQTVE